MATPEVRPGNLNQILCCSLIKSAKCWGLSLCTIFISLLLRIRIFVAHKPFCTSLRCDPFSPLVVTRVFLSVCCMVLVSLYLRVLRGKKVEHLFSLLSCSWCIHCSVWFLSFSLLFILFLRADGQRQCWVPRENELSKRSNDYEVSTPPLSWWVDEWVYGWVGTGDGAYNYFGGWGAFCENVSVTQCSGLTILLSRHSVGSYQETSSHTTC